MIFINHYQKVTVMIQKLLICLLFGLGISIHACADTQKSKPVIIFLNGTSSAGKTSIAHKLQEFSSEPLTLMGLDLVDFLWNNRFIMFGSEAGKGFQFIRKDDVEGKKLIIQSGPEGKRFIHGLHRAIKAMVDSGLPIVLDEFVFDPEDMQDYIEVLRDYTVYFIAVKPPVEVAEQREIARGDREVGLARGLYKAIYGEYNYDLVIDSSLYTPEESARLILKYMEQHPTSQVFQSNAVIKNERR